jgi:hypothetical protein
MLHNNFSSLYEDGGSEPIAPTYSKFLKDFHWMHIVSQMANHEFLNLERVLDYNVMDVFSYLQYINAKANAENIQQKFTMDLNKKRK